MPVTVAVASSAPFFLCACGVGYADRAAWSELPDRRTYVDTEGSLVERRRCTCGSHGTVALLAALDVEELRRAVRVIDRMNETFNQRYTALELLLLMRACWISEWDFTPDDWTAEQRSRALSDGYVPRWEETSGGYHALGVGDCWCSACSARKRP